MSSVELYTYIVAKYGKRALTVTELAKKLSISPKSARLLTQALGYHRTKRTSAVQFNTFAANKAVTQILPKIKVA